MCTMFILVMYFPCYMLQCQSSWKRTFFSILPRHSLCCPINVTQFELEYNGRISVLKLLLIIESRRSMFKILQTLHYTVHFIVLPKFPTFVSLTLILNMPAIILQTPCCHSVMTLKIPLICKSPLRVSFGTCTIL